MNGRFIYIVTAKGESFLAAYSNDCKRSIEERFEIVLALWAVKK